MRKLSRIRPSILPLQWRLTLWYLLTLAVILLLFATFVYLQLRSNLLNQMDTSLQVAASQTRIGVNNGEKRLAFQVEENQSDGAASVQDDFILYLTAADGSVWDKSGRLATVPPLQPPQPGLTTVLSGDDHWRVFSQEVSAAEVTGWMQIIGPMDPINDTLDRLLTLMLLGGPLALILAGLGGFFLAGRALRPIDRMTRTAQTISASDLNRRIQYEGPADEVGRLARTFDSMLDRLQTAFERERRFTGDAAHELRTPLTALKGSIGVTLSQPRRPEAYADTLQEMEGQVDRLIRLSNDLLFMARLDQGQMAPRMERIDVQEVLGAVVDQIRPLALAKSITLTQTIPAGLSVKGDVDLLFRLFLNLLDNAVKYTPVGGRVTIQAQPQAPCVQITINDSGPGIPAENLPYLFQRFYRVEGDRARSGRDDGGAGLGLALAYEIARFHGGELLVQSSEAEGTTFILQLPAPG